MLFKSRWGEEGLPCTGGQVVTFRSFLSLITSSWSVSFREHTQRLYHPCYLLPLTCRGCGCCGLPENVGRMFLLLESRFHSETNCSWTIPYHSLGSHSFLHGSYQTQGRDLHRRQPPFRNSELKTVFYCPVKEWKHIRDLLSVLANVGCKSQSGGQFKPSVMDSHWIQLEIKLKCNCIQNFLL